MLTLPPPSSYTHTPVCRLVNALIVIIIISFLSFFLYFCLWWWKNYSQPQKCTKDPNRISRHEIVQLKQVRWELKGCLLFVLMNYLHLNDSLVIFLRFSEEKRHTVQCSVCQCCWAERGDGWGEKCRRKAVTEWGIGWGKEKEEQSAAVNF